MGPAPNTAHDTGRFAAGALPPPSFDSFGWAPVASMTKAMSPEGIPFVYHGWQFALRAEGDDRQGFKAVVFWCMHGTERMTLPTVRDLFDSEDAAIGCAERQAVRWVREHMGYGRAGL